MDPRKMLARLGPKSPRLISVMNLGTSCSSKPTVDLLTDQDIAAALTHIRHPLARAVYEHLWVPGVAENKHAVQYVIDRAAYSLVIRYTRDKAKARNPWPDFPAKLGLPIPKWPAAPPAMNFARRVADAGLRELVRRKDCPDCHGFGRLLLKAEKGGLKIESCPKCLGTGTVPYTKADRARLLRVRRATFTAQVEPAYDWLIGRLRTLEEEAAHQHWMGLQDGEERAP